MKPRLLDLFCGAGGAGKGYADAGFEVVGVDIAPQPRYPFEFHQADALDVLRRLVAGEEWNGYVLADFAVIHASPPCQAFSSITLVRGRAEDHPDLIGPVRALLEESGLPYVIENVVRAPLLAPVLICGVALGLRIPEGILRRHRLFESNVAFLTPGCGCHRGDGKTLGVYGGGTSQKTRTSPTGGGRPDKANRDQARLLMEMPWATRQEMNQAIPPAYTELIGYQLMQHIARVPVSPVELRTGG